MANKAHKTKTVKRVERHPEPSKFPEPRKFSEEEVTDMLRTAFNDGKQSVTPPPTPVAGPDFKLNGNGLPEFASIVLTLDHLTATQDGHVKLKTVLSSQSAEESLIGLFKYYGEHEKLLSLSSTLDQLLINRQSPERGIFLYVVPVDNAVDRFGGPIVQVVMSTALFNELVKHPDYGNTSEMICTTKLLIAFENILNGVKKRGGGYPPLTFITAESMLAE